MNLIEFSAEFWPNDGVAKGVAIQLNKASQLIPLLHVQQVTGIKHHFAREESGGEIARRSINVAFADTKNGTLMPDEERLEIAGAHIQTDHRLVGATGGKARANEISRRTRALGRYMDKQLIRGEGQTDATQITGLAVRVADDQVIEAGANGAALTLDLFEQLIDLVEDQGAGRFVFAPKVTCRKLKSLIVKSAGGASLTEVANGVMSYEGVKIIAAERDEAGLPLMGYNETQGNSNITASMLCIAPGTEDDTGVNLLMASNSIELIPEGTVKAMVIDTLEVMYGVCMFHKRAIARLKGITK